METLNCTEKFVCRVLRAGVVPQHIGFIMDGNRRFAKKNKLGSVHQGHVEGVNALKKCLLFCKELGIHEISLFCFSVENFNRSKQEVDGLMELCLKTFDEMSAMSEMLLSNKINVNIVGRKDLLRSDVREALEKIEEKTVQFTSTVVNLCFAYDSLNEIQSSLNSMQSPSYPNFIKGLAIPRHLDILVRTANEHRLSNFMLPQTAYAYVCLLKENWPELGIFSLCKVILGYNYSFKYLSNARQSIRNKLSQSGQLSTEETNRLIQNKESPKNN